MALATKVDDVIENILRFDAELKRDPALQTRLGHVHAWYAFKDEAGIWRYGPSKFVGYAQNTAAHYLLTAQNGSDGRRTEMQLRKWAAPVDPDTWLGRELMDSLRKFVGEWGRSLRENVRISVVQRDTTPRPADSEPRNNLLARITSNPDVTGGRPCIKGTRMRVSDVLGMLAVGASRAEILEDFPYLVDDDISAALLFAAKASEHRIIKAA